MICTNLDDSYVMQCAQLIVAAGSDGISRTVSAGTLISASDNAVAPEAKSPFDLPRKRVQTPKCSSFADIVLPEMFKFRRYRSHEVEHAVLGRSREQKFA